MDSIELNLSPRIRFVGAKATRNVSNESIQITNEKRTLNKKKKNNNGDILAYL